MLRYLVAGFRLRLLHSDRDRDRVGESCNVVVAGEVGQPLEVSGRDDLVGRDVDPKDMASSTTRALTAILTTCAIGPRKAASMGGISSRRVS